jgi:hypothetical protein
MPQDADTKRSEDPKYSTEDSIMNTYTIPEKPQPNVPTTQPNTQQETHSPSRHQ